MGGSQENWNAIQYRQTSLSSTFTATPTTARPYNADACGSSWINYVKSDISNYSTWWRQLYRSIAWEEKYAMDGTGADSDFVSATGPVTDTITEIIRKVIPTQCDGNPRISSISEEILFVTRTTTDLTSLRPTLSNAPPRPRPILPSTPRIASGPYPTCYIQPDDCQQQWNLFQQTFRNGSLGFEALSLLPYEFGPSQLVGYNAALGVDKMDIDRWLWTQGYGNIRGFFGKCTQAADICFDHFGDGGTDNLTDFSSSLSEAKRWVSASSNIGKDYKPWWRHDPRDRPKCYLGVDRFVLIHFPPTNPNNMSRNLCGMKAVTGAAFPSSNSSVTMTAVLHSIVFGAKTQMAAEGYFATELSKPGYWAQGTEKWSSQCARLINLI
jgi:hypothetical protein